MSVLLTGATGFVGMEILARLLGKGQEVACLIRGSDPRERLSTTLDTMGVSTSLRANARAISGVVTAPLPRLPGISTVVHCAASVSFGLELAEARRINVDGTRHALAAAERASARYVHVSTAYVAGRHSGVFREGHLECGQSFRNTYERSKLEAEVLVAESGADAVVLRPSIVMGESTTGWTPAFNVLYWPLRAFDRGLLASVPARPGARVDVVPVDYVADAIVHVATGRRDLQGVLHLVAGNDALTIDRLLDLAASTLERARPPLSVLDREFAERTPDGARYLPYFDMEMLFDDRRARDVLRPAGIEAPRLEEYFDRLMAFARAARWGKHPLPRRAAAVLARAT